MDQHGEREYRVSLPVHLAPSYLAELFVPVLGQSEICCAIFALKSVTESCQSEPTKQYLICQKFCHLVSSSILYDTSILKQYFDIPGVTGFASFSNSVYWRGCRVVMSYNLKPFAFLDAQPTKYVGSPCWRAKMYTGRVACCPPPPVSR